MRYVQLKQGLMKKNGLKHLRTRPNRNKLRRAIVKMLNQQPQLAKIDDPQPVETLEEKKEDKTEEQIDEKKEKKLPYKCKIDGCQERFPNNSQLGIHIGKCHPRSAYHTREGKDRQKTDQLMKQVTQEAFEQFQLIYSK